MAYDEGLAERIRSHLSATAGVGEKRMFGGIAFLLHGNMMIGIVRDELMVRVGPAQEAAALAKPGARPMDFTGRPMKGYVFVSPDGCAEEDELAEWIAMGQRFVATLPPK